MKKIKYILAHTMVATVLLLVPAFSSAQLLNKGQSNNPFPFPTSGNYSNSTPADPFSIGQNWKGSANTGTTSGQSNSGSNNSCKTHTSGCQNSTCKVKVNSSGRIIEECPAKSVRRNDIDANCMKQQNKQSGNCLDTVPVASVSRVAENTCARLKSKGWGNRSNPNHYGMDYASSQGTKVTAAADGRVVWNCKPMNGAGRVVCLEHEKKCQCTVGNPGGSCHEKYVTCYLHLKNCDPAKSKSTFKKGETLGAVGGSNYSGGVLYDYPEYYPQKAYGPHLHFEIYSGAWGKGGYMGLKQDLINPQCDDIQTFCGNTGCYDVAQCGGKPTQYTGESGDTMYEGGSDSGSSSGSSSSSSASSEATEALAKCYLSQYLPGPDDCTFCPIFRIIFNAGSTVAIRSYEALAKGVANLVIAAFAIWLSIVVLRHISSMEVKDPGKLIQEILLQAFRVLIVWVILQGNFFQVMSLTLEPVFNTGLKYTQEITQTQECSDSAPFLEGLKGYDSQSGSGFNASAEGGLPKSMGKNILCTIKSIQDSVSLISAYGRQAICLSTKKPYVFLWIIPHFPMLLTGCFLYLTGLLLLLAFPWCLVDCVLNMCIAAGLAPAAVGAWAFKTTASYLKKIWDFFMNAMFNFVFLGIVIYIIIVAVQQIMGVNGITAEAEDVNMFLDPIDGLAYWGTKALQLFCVCLLGWVFLDQGKKFAKSFSNVTGVSNGNIGRSVGGAMAQGAKRMGQTAGKIGMKGGGALYDAGKNGLGGVARKIATNVRVNRTMKKGNAIYDQNGKITGYERTRRNLLTGFRKVTSRVDIGEDGSKTWSRQTNSIMGPRAAAMKWMNKRRLNKLINKGEEIRDKDGQITGYTMSWKRFGRNITLTATKDENGNFQLSKDKTSLRMRALAAMTKDGSKLNKFAQKNMNAVHRDLMPETHTNITKSDQMATIKQTKDKTGKIIEEKIIFKTRLIKHIINADGTINLKDLDKIMQNTNFDESTMYRALAVEILSQRGINLDESFASRKATLLQNGILVLQQINNNGSKTELAMAIAGLNSDQMITDIKTTTADGSFSRIIDNGIMKKTVNYNSQDQQASASYRFANIYYQQNGRQEPLNSQGTFANYINQAAAMAGFEQDDLLNHMQQLKTGKMVNVDPSQSAVQDSVFKADGIRSVFQTPDQRPSEEKLVDDVIASGIVSEDVQNIVLDMAIKDEQERLRQQEQATNSDQSRSVSRSGQESSTDQTLGAGRGQTQAGVTNHEVHQYGTRSAEENTLDEILASDQYTEAEKELALDIAAEKERSAEEKALDEILASDQYTEAEKELALDIAAEKERSAEENTLDEILASDQYTEAEKELALDIVAEEERREREETDRSIEDVLFDELTDSQPDKPIEDVLFDELTDSQPDRPIENVLFDELTGSNTTAEDRETRQREAEELERENIRREQEEIKAAAEREAEQKRRQDEIEQRRAAQADIAARKENERLELEAKQAREREEIERKIQKEQEIQRREEAERKKAEWEATLEKGRERKERVINKTEGMPDRKIERPDSLGGMTKKRRRKPGKK